MIVQICFIVLFPGLSGGYEFCNKERLTVATYYVVSMCVVRVLQLCFSKIQKWADENGFKFSQTKTVCMHFCSLRKLHPEPTLTLNDLAIPVVQEHKFLGVIFDNKLSFIPHIKYLKARCLKALNLLKVVSRFDWGADSIVLLRLYRALVRSKLDYGSILYGSARKSCIGMLAGFPDGVQCLSLGAFRTSPVESIYVEANEESLYRRRERLVLQYAIKLSSTPNNPTFDTVFRPKYSEIFAIRPNDIATFGFYREPSIPFPRHFIMLFILILNNVTANMLP